MSGVSAGDSMRDFGVNEMHNALPFVTRGYPFRASTRHYYKMSDEDYYRQVEALKVQGPLKVSSTYLLEDFQVLEGEAW